MHGMWGGTSSCSLVHQLMLYEGHGATQGSHAEVIAYVIWSNMRPGHPAGLDAAIAGLVGWVCLHC